MIWLAVIYTDAKPQWRTTQVHLRQLMGPLCPNKTTVGGTRGGYGSKQEAVNCRPLLVSGAAYAFPVTLAWRTWGTVSKVSVLVSRSVVSGHHDFVLLLATSNKLLFNFFRFSHRCAIFWWSLRSAILRSGILHLLYVMNAAASSFQ